MYESGTGTSTGERTGFLRRGKRRAGRSPGAQALLKTGRPGADPRRARPACPGAYEPTEASISLIERVRPATEDPTAEWADTCAQATPAFDWSDLRLGPIAFGDPLEKAEPLGRPDRFRWTQPGYCELLYARRGLQIDFDRGRFAYLAWFIGRDSVTPDHPDMTFCTPALDDELALTRDMGIDDLRAHLGAPVSEDVGEDETVLFYTGGGVVLEFEFDGEGRLKRWNLYPES